MLVRMSQTEKPQEACERAAASPPDPAMDRYDGVPLGAEAFIPFLAAQLKAG